MIWQVTIENSGITQEKEASVLLRRVRCREISIMI